MEIKFLTKSGKHDILYLMRFFYYLLLILCITILPAFAQDEVQKGGVSTVGKIIAYSDGLIQIRSAGVETSFVREKNDDFYSDYISYRERPIAGGRVDVNCRVLFIDNYYVIFKTPTAVKIQVPRYRVSTIVLNAN